MRSLRIAIIFALLASLSFSFSRIGRAVVQPEPLDTNEYGCPSLVAAYHGAEPLPTTPSRDDQGGGIKEEIPDKYAARYQEWKKEFLSTDAGRNQWAYYQSNRHFALTIQLSRENAEGATTGNYRWNEAGQLVSATITLGSRLDQGYPNPIYFPVMNSLLLPEAQNRIAGVTLAATKLAHEFGHVNRTAKVDPKQYQLQSQLMPQYNRIFLSNGRDANDPRLLELTRQLGGTPVEIWEDREYWGEANAMVYLGDRFTENGLRCSLFSRMRQSIDLYAKSYEGRFLAIVQSTPSHRFCGWQ